MDEARAPTAYEGDAVLARLLAAAGSPYEPAALRALIAGVLAAPPGPSPDAWMVLVAPQISPELAAQLRALAASLGQAAPAKELAPAERLARLRAELARQGIQGFLVPRADEHQGEYVPASAQRLAWLTGFTGSAGLAIVLTGRAALFVDGRYTLQVRTQADAALYEFRHISEQPAAAWIAEHLGKGVLGFDPWLHTPGEVERFRAAAERAGGTLRALATNPIDKVWADRPPPPLAPVVLHPLRFAGKSAEEKRREVAASLAKDAVDAVVLTAPDSIAWLLNIRGGDVPHTPLALGFAILHRDASVDLFMDARKLAPGLDAHLGAGVQVAAPAELG
ncbi:MAG TPA: aminopeptidase P family N-terminal domain-containing protein, partial [Stellaceae bacterium]|nr:aminopeptidase P family N-terminal domain-containing protein [Stellaceae bacterium]